MMRRSLTAEDVTVEAEGSEVESEVDAARGPAAGAQGDEKGREVVFGGVAALRVGGLLAVGEQRGDVALPDSPRDPVVEFARPRRRFARAALVPLEVAQVVHDAAGGEHEHVLPAQPAYPFAQP